jgi:hypothetical protein
VRVARTEGNEPLLRRKRSRVRVFIVMSRSVLTRSVELINRAAYGFGIRRST